MKINAIILAALVALTAAATVLMDSGMQAAKQAKRHDAPAVRQAVPDAELQLAKGGTARLHDYKGGAVILHFWASWCAPCVEEFPQLLAMAKEMKDVTVIAVSADENSAEMDRFLDKTPYRAIKNVVIARDPQQKISRGLFHTVRLPESILIGPDMTMRGKIAGAAEWDSPALRQKIRDLD